MQQKPKYLFPEICFALFIRSCSKLLFLIRTAFYGGLSVSVLENVVDGSVCNLYFEGIVYSYWRKELHSVLWAFLLLSYLCSPSVCILVAALRYLFAWLVDSGWIWKDFNGKMAVTNICRAYSETTQLFEPIWYWEVLLLEATIYLQLKPFLRCRVIYFCHLCSLPIVEHIMWRMGYILSWRQVSIT